MINVTHIATLKVKAPVKEVGIHLPPEVACNLSSSQPGARHKAWRAAEERVAYVLKTRHGYRPRQRLGPGAFTLRPAPKDTSTHFVASDTPSDECDECPMCDAGYHDRCRRGHCPVTDNWR